LDYIDSTALEIVAMNASLGDCYTLAHSSVDTLHKSGEFAI
jgi:hypothetical protein